MTSFLTTQYLMRVRHRMRAPHANYRARVVCSRARVVPGIVAFLSDRLASPTSYLPRIDRRSYAKALAFTFSTTQRRHVAVRLPQPVAVLTELTLLSVTSGSSRLGLFLIVMSTSTLRRAS